MHIGQLAQPVSVYRRATLLREALPTLQRGAPVIVERSDQHWLLMPEHAAGTTRCAGSTISRFVLPKPSTT